MAVAGYNPFIPSDRQKQYMASQQAEALAQALLSEGEKPIDTNNRSINGVGYNISPMEGVAKLANILSGSYVQNKANESLANALTGGSGGGQAGVGNLPPQVAALAQAYPEIGVKAIMDNALADHRAGSTYYDMGSGGRITAPTDQQINTGTVPQPQGVPPPNFTPAPIAPVQGSPLPPPQGAMPPQTANFPPPSPSAVGASAIAQGAPPVSGAALAPPQGMAPPSSIAPPTPRPINTAGMTASQAQAAMDTEKARMAAEIDVNKANQIAAGAVGPAGEKTQAEDTGKNLADATKTYNVAAGQFPRAMQRFDQLRQASAHASSGSGVSDKEPDDPGFFDRFLPGPDWARSAARTFPESVVNPAVSNANQVIHLATSQGILSELGPQLAGLRGNKFLESIASGASGLNPADPPAAKINTINGLQDQYISNMVSLANQRRSYGDPSAPSHLSMAQMIAQYASPQAMISVVDPRGKLARIPPSNLVHLIQDGGQLR